MWKDFERRVARQVGGHRLGATGAATPDVVSTWCVVECKERKTLPAWLTDALAGVRTQAGADRLGIVALHQVGAHDALVLMSFADFVAWYGNPDASDGE